MGMEYWPAEGILIDRDAEDFPKSDYEWRLIEETLKDSQWNYGKDPDHGWPYP